MTEKRVFILAHKTARDRAIAAVMYAPDGYAITVQPRGRNLDQNAAQWPILQAFADQLVWPVNGSMVKLTADEWKDILTAAFRQESPRVAAGINGGMVMLAQRTSKFSKQEFSAWLDFLNATAVDRGVVVEAELAF